MRSLIAGRQFFILTKSSAFPSTPSSNVFFNKNTKSYGCASNNDIQIMHSPILRRQLIYCLKVPTVLQRPSNVFVVKRARSHGVCAPIYEPKLTLCEDRERLLKFMRTHFYREEPLRIGCVPIIQEANDENFHLQNIPRETCVMIVRPDQNDYIVASVCAAPRQANSLAGLADNYGPYSKWGRILKVWAKVEKDANVYERYGVTRALHAYSLAVHQNYRGYGLGMRVLSALGALGKKKKFELLTIDATSIYAACLCQRLGMKLVNTLAYRDYKDEKGYIVFSPPGSSDAIRTYAMRL